MRLIDADAFNDWILSHFAEPQSALILTLQGFIAEQPTAYDIDKVVEELEELADKSYKAYCIDFYSGDRAKYDACTNAIKIVKQDGVSDVCEWTQPGDMAISPHTSSKYKIKQCDGLYALNACPYCRKKIKVVE